MLRPQSALHRTCTSLDPARPTPCSPQAQTWGRGAPTAHLTHHVKFLSHLQEAPEMHQKTDALKQPGRKSAACFHFVE